MAIRQDLPGESVRAPRARKAWTLNRMGLFGLGIALLLLAGFPPAVAASTTDPTVAITDYQVTPAILLPGDQGTITITLANTASTATSTESTVQNGVSGTTTSTTTKDLTVLVESVYLYGKGVEVLEGNFQQVGALGPGQSLNSPS